MKVVFIHAAVSMDGWKINNTLCWKWRLHSPENCRCCYKHLRLVPLYNIVILFKHQHGRTTGIPGGYIIPIAFIRAFIQGNGHFGVDTAPQNDIADASRKSFIWNIEGNNTTTHIVGRYGQCPKKWSASERLMRSWWQPRAEMKVCNECFSCRVRIWFNLN